MNRRKRLATAIVLATLAAIGVTTYLKFNRDLTHAREHALRDSRVIDTRCGPIEYQETGTGDPLLMIHGSGGGHDQGIAFARNLIPSNVRVIAPSRFGYLRTPRPNDASPEAQADAHACLLDALGVDRVAVFGGSAGSPSALQFAIRHRARTSALILIVPITYKPIDVAASAPEISDRYDRILSKFLASDFLYWLGLQVARDQIFRYVLATPPELIAAASSEERARVNSLAEEVLPVSLRAAGLLDDTKLGKSLKPYALETIAAPTLIISARDDGFGTFANAQYTAQRIAGAKLVGFETGGHLLVGREREARSAIADVLSSLAK